MKEVEFIGLEMNFLFEYLSNSERKIEDFQLKYLYEIYNLNTHILDSATHPIKFIDNLINQLGLVFNFLI